MTTIAFTVPGRIGGKGRPRFVRATGAAFTPAKTRNVEAMVKDFGSEAMKGAGPLEGPLWLTIRIFVMPAQSWPEKRKAAAMHVTGKPDLDNVLKLIGDALNGTCWRDDAQLAAVTIQRTYTRTGPERAEISFGPLQAFPAAEIAA